MVSSRKRSFQEVDKEDVQAPKEPSLLQRIRNMWQLANIAQFLAIFGPAVKIEPPDMDELEAECLKPHSTALQEIGLGMLKFLSSHRGLTLELFDEYSRRQFTSKAPEIENPFGNDEVALRFADFDVFKKIRVLHQMTQLMLRQSEKLRERMSEIKDADHDHTAWKRIEPIGWDEDDRTYFLLDDNRLYRLTDAPPPKPPAPKPKKNSKKARAAARAAKRRRVSGVADSIVDHDEDGNEDVQDDQDSKDLEQLEDDGLGGAKWECITVSLDDVNQFLESFKKTKDPNEKILRKQVQDHLVPILEREEEKRQKKIRERERELLNLEKMANAKRSSRLAHKAEKTRIDEQTQAEKLKQLEQEAAARKEQENLRKIEKERNSRLMSREKRLREREARRLQHERELSVLSEDSKSVGSAPGRMSERRREAEIQRAKRALEELDDEEEEWVFDCVCGLHGQVDDGEHSVACERCNVWQHSKCLGIDQDEAEREDFHFICGPCKRRQEENERLRPRGTVIKIKLGSASSSPATAKAAPAAQNSESSQDAKQSTVLSGAASENAAELGTKAADPPASTVKTPRVGDLSFTSASSPVLPPPQEHQNFTIPIKSAAAAPLQSTETRALQRPNPDGVHNPFSSPHPDLSPPSQSPTKARAYHTVFEQSSPSNVVGDTNGQKTNGRVHPSTTPVLAPAQPRAESAAAMRPQSPTKASFDSSRQPLQSKAQSPGANTLPGPLTTPQFKPGFSENRSVQRPSPLPPSSAGMSPTKHSPSFPPTTMNGLHPSSSPTPPVFPPIEALSPSPRPQDPTPPVKPSTPASSFNSGIP
ncbi:hypothetical protein ACKVWC_009125 [Pyricularia oryzae]